MNKVTTLGIFISLIIGITCFISSNNWIIALVIFALGIIYFFFLASSMVKRYVIKSERFHQCYHFINTFIVSLSIKGTVSAAYESTLETMGEDFKKSIENIEELSSSDRLDYLNKYFRFHAFSLFIDLIKIYEDQGGDIIDMSSYLLEDLKNTEEYISTSSAINRKKITEFVILWLLSLSIMIFLRFALSTFFITISKQFFYPLGIFAISLFCLVSVHLAIYKMCKLKIKGWDDHEKI